MKILVIFTGGTIGSCEKNGSIATDESTKYVLINRYKSIRGGANFDISTPFSVLSENLSANELNLIQKEIIGNLDKGYDGIIVTHGTDTLQYTAAAIEYAICGCSIPVVLVSSDYPLEDESSNGHANFEAAVEFIKSKPEGGVFVSYKNSGDAFTSIHLASRILQHAECSADIFSIESMPYARYDGAVTLCGTKQSENQNALGYVPYTENSAVLVVDSRPGDNYSYSLEGIKAVILKPYHSATLCTASASLEAFCKRAADAEIPVFTVNVKHGISYESTELFAHMNIISLPFSTYIAAYIKIWAAVSLGADTAKFAQRQIANELV